MTTATLPRHSYVGWFVLGLIALAFVVAGSLGEGLLLSAPATLNDHAAEKHGEGKLSAPVIFQRWNDDDFCLHRIFWNGTQLMHVFEYAEEPVLKGLVFTLPQGAAPSAELLLQDILPQTTVTAFPAKPGYVSHVIERDRYVEIGSIQGPNCPAPAQ